MRILVADKLAEEGLEFLKQTGIQFDTKVGLKEDELAAAVGAYDALIVRSGAKVTAKVLEKPGNLKAIARAGVGVDNIDLDAATAKGILVLNTAEASTLSTAEHPLAVMMSLARTIPQAHAHVKSGQWNKTLFQGTQLAGKTPGVLGLENVVLTPHLGASTDEAQTAVSVDACRAIVAYLRHGEIRGAVNAGGVKLDLPPDEAPFAKLASRIGAMLAALSDSGYKTITL